MNVECLIRILEKIPGDYNVLVKHADFEIPLKRVVEVDVQEKKLVLK